MYGLSPNHIERTKYLDDELSSIDDLSGSIQDLKFASFRKAWSKDSFIPKAWPQHNVNAEGAMDEGDANRRIGMETIFSSM